MSEEEARRLVTGVQKSLAILVVLGEARVWAAPRGESAEWCILVDWARSGKTDEIDDGREAGLYIRLWLEAFA